MNPNSQRRGQLGFTLIEVLIASAIFSIGILGFMQSFGFIARAVHTTRTRTIAANYVQAEVETLKNNSYYSLQVTTVTTVNNNFSPGLVYSAGAYRETTTSIGGIPFTMAARVDFVALVNGVLTTMSYTDPDPGMKKLTVFVMWRDGVTWKYMSLSNLLENPNVAPQTATITGTVREVGPNTAIAGAAIKTLENPSLAGTTNASGVYSFKVNAGTYTVACSSSSFYFQITTSTYVSAGTTYTKDFYMYRVATGTAQGYAWLRPTSRFLISQIVTDTNTYVPSSGGNQDVQFVELVNPTTTSLPMNFLELYWYNNSPSSSHYAYTYGYSYFGLTPPFVTFRSTYIPPLSYFLVANTSNTFVLFNSTVSADAWFDGYYNYDGTSFTTQTGPYGSVVKKNGDDGNIGSTLYVYVYDSSWDMITDYVGWKNGNGSNSAPPNKKTDYPRCDHGIDVGEQLIRFSSPAWTSSNALRVYDTENNRYDFECNRYTTSSRPMTLRAFNIESGTQTAISGVPAYGALVSVNDTFSNSTQAYQVSVTTASGGLSYPAALFTLQGISTGTWQVDVASGSLYTIISTVTIRTGGETVWVPSTGTVAAATSFQNSVGLYAAPVVSDLSIAGTIPSNTYYYRVTAIDASGNEDLGSGELVTPVNTGYVHFSWGAVPGASSYRVYRGTYTAGQTGYISTNSFSFTDTGASGTAGTPPRTSAFGHSVITSTGVFGYVSGYVWDISGAPLANIAIVAGGIPKTTNAQGYYSAAVATGAVTVIINSSNANSSYVSDTFNVTVDLGAVTRVDDYLLRGGTLRGYVTSGVSALPNINVAARVGNTQMGSGTSDSSGYFYIYNLSTGSYTVTPALDPVADASPDDYTATVTQGVTTFIGTFTVVGAYGTITGTVKKNTTLITTGALIIASSVTISATPPTIVASSSAAQSLYYSVSSLSDGTYTLLVRGATHYTYNIRAFYPTLNGQAVTTANISYTGLSVAPAGSVTKNVVIP